MKLRPWIAIPIIGAIAVLAQLAVGYGATTAIAGGALAAALAAAARAYGGEQPAAIAGAATGALIGVAAALAAAHAAGVDSIRACAAGAAAAWTFAELVRPAPATTRPAVALLPAAIAALLDPAYAGLILLAGIRLWRAPQRVGRWPIVIPLAGAIAIALAAATLVARGHGALGSLAELWLGAPPATHAHAAGVRSLAAATASALGPIAALAALVGAVMACARSSTVATILIAIAVGAAAASLHQGTVWPALPVLAGLAAGIATARLASAIGFAPGQACVGATVGAIAAAVPAWTLWIAVR